MPLISDELIEKALREYRVVTTPAIRLAIQKYISLLLRWNERVSLTTITEPLDILRFHFGECMYAAHAVPIRDGRLADVGSGAGFPGLPLKILVPSLDLVLIESNIKKASFLSECVRELSLSGVKVTRSRFEDLDKKGPDFSHFSFITARALGSYPDLIRWARQALLPNGALALWLGQNDAAKFQEETSFAWKSPIALPGSDRRVILVGTHK
ncbi:MAG: 16S rRNA (guanine(527)-N(7))-methyltransferase RsmG [Candidatus Acidiferrales bacterium]